jgi:hypothetical protein
MGELGGRERPHAVKRLLALLLVGCSSDPVKPTPDAGPDTNPAGELCPTENVGHVPSAGTARVRIANLKFKGVSLCDYYNPTGKNGNYQLIHLGAVARWCGPCQLEASAISGYDYLTQTRTGPGIAADLAPQGVVFIEAIVESDTPNVPAKAGDLQIWIDSHQTNFPVALDPAAAVLHDFLPTVETLPWNVDIDARSMEILAIGTGYSTTLEDDLKKVLTALPQPPMP